MIHGDAQLWSEILEGKDQAWRTLIVRYASLVNTVVVRSGLSSQEAADVFQTVWAILYERRKSIKEPSRISAWLVTTAKRESIRAKVRRTPDADPESVKALEMEDSNALPDETLERVEQQSHLETALFAIDPRCRKLLERLFFAEEEVSYEQIGEQLGIAFNSLGPTRQRCLEKLKKVLMESGYLDVRK